jgi:hypothetical protein
VYAVTWAIILISKVMRTPENNQNPLILVDGGGKQYQVTLPELTEFLNSCKQKLQVTSINDIEAEINALTELVIDATADNRPAGDLKHKLIFLRELTFLFKGMLYEWTQ